MQNVALYMSAWIEIVAVLLTNLKLSVALYMSAWIEIDETNTTFTVPGRRTLHECVD